jgi:hypothetical protein
MALTHVLVRLANPARPRRFARVKLRPLPMVLAPGLPGLVTESN